MFVIASIGVLIYYFCPRYGSTNVLIYVVICSLAGSLSVIGIKVCACMHRQAGNMLFEYSSILVFAVAVFAVAVLAEALFQSFDWLRLSSPVINTCMC